MLAGSKLWSERVLRRSEVRISMYWKQSMIPSIRCNRLTPWQVKHPQTIMCPLPWATFFFVYPGSNPSLLWLDPHFLSFFTACDLSCDHHVITYVTYCSHDVYHVYCMWPIVQVTFIVPVTSIVLVTISTSSLWPYSLRLDFLHLMVQQCNQSPIPTLIPLSLLSQGYSLKATVADDSSLRQTWRLIKDVDEPPKFKNQAWRGDKSRAEHRVHCGE